MKKYVVISKLFILIFLFSCEDEFDNQQNHLTSGTILKEIKINDVVHTKFEFNKSGLLTVEKSKYHYSKYIYNNSNKLIKSEHYWDERLFSSSTYVLEELRKDPSWISPENSNVDVFTTYEYDQFGKLKRTETNRLNNNFQSNSEFQCNKKGQIITQTWENDNRPNSVDKFYYNSLGNLVKKERYYGNELQTTTEYEFDNHPNPFFLFSSLMIPGRNTNPNNIVNETYTIHFDVDDFIDKIQVTNYNYEYNHNGYPVKVNDTTEYVYE